MKSSLIGLLPCFNLRIRTVWRDAARNNYRSAGGVVPGAKVTAHNLATNETREFTSDESGNFQFNALPSGTYHLTVVAPSFKQTKLVANQA